MGDKYDGLTLEIEVEILMSIVAQEGENILYIDEVYSALREHFNNTILDIYEKYYLEEEVEHA